uniref:Uncharacterized protein n=1 Tax=Anguilla anguilla TaxID=7936 RepID=A0A0E9RBY3_ANGAN
MNVLKMINPFIENSSMHCNQQGMSLPITISCHYYTMLLDKERSVHYKLDIQNKENLSHLSNKNEHILR